MIIVTNGFSISPYPVNVGIKKIKYDILRSLRGGGGGEVDLPAWG